MARARRLPAVPQLDANGAERPRATPRERGMARGSAQRPTAPTAVRSAYFDAAGKVDVPSPARFASATGRLHGPAIIDGGLTTRGSAARAVARAHERRRGPVEPRRGCDREHAPRPAARPTRRPIDGVRLAVLANRFEAIARSMMNTLVRTGRSGVLNTAQDFSCAILTAANELLAVAESQPVHVLTGRSDDAVDGRSAPRPAAGRRVPA